MATLSYITFVFLFASVPVQLEKVERSAISFVAQFAIEKLASFALDTLVNVGSEQDVSSKLFEIDQSLEKIKNDINELKTDIQDLKETQTITDASSIESQIRVIIDKYQTILAAARTFKDTTSATTNEQLQKDIDELNKEVRKIPGLLIKLDLLITGKTTVAAGRLEGLVCDYVAHILRELSSSTGDTYSLSASIGKMFHYLDSLIKFQVMSFQLYNTTCSVDDVTCKQEELNLEKRLQGQQEHFKQCIPRYLEDIRQKGKLENIHIMDKSNTVLYSNQKSSVLIDGLFDYDKIDSPQDAGLRCTQGDQSEIWSLIDAGQHDRRGFYLQQKSGCVLSYDRPFMGYEKIIPTFWTSNDRIERKEFLICLPSITADAVTFLISATEARIDSRYTLKNADTGKYLNIHVEKTSIHEEIDHRLVLVLFLDNDQKTWGILPEGNEIGKCDSSKATTTAEVGGSDVGYPIIIGIVVGGVLALAVIIGLVIYCKRRNN